MKYKDNITLSNKIYRKIWEFISFLFFRPFPGLIFNNYRILVLKIFGASIGKGTIIYSSAKIPAPWNLSVGNYTCIGPNVQLHIDKITIGSKVTISQNSYLCTGSHDISSLNTPYVSSPIIIEDYVWVAADSFIMMGVIIKKGAVVGARSAVFKDVDSWTVVGGNPAKFIKKREVYD